MLRRPGLNRSANKGFTIIEVATYVALISISMTMLISFEIMTKQSVTDQRIQLQVAQQPDLLFRKLNADLANSTRIELLDSGKGLKITAFDGQVVIYQPTANPASVKGTCLARSATLSNGKPQVIPFTRLLEAKFNVRSGFDDKPIVDLEVQALRAKRGRDKLILTPFKWAFRPLHAQN